jgi:Flp pilus assembly protein TadB
MSYHFGYSPKAPQTKKEKSQAAKQFFVAALIFAAAAAAFAGWGYRQMKKEDEKSKAIAQSQKKNEQLYRDIVRSQGKTPRETPSSANETPATASGYSGSISSYIPPMIVGAVSLLMFGMGILYTVEARRMPDAPENRERRF